MNAESPAISLEEYERIATLVQQRLGIQLLAGKQVMLCGRLRGMVEKHGCRSFSELLDRHLADPTPEILSELADRVSTNHTFFNREPAHFAFLHEVMLPDITQRLRARGRLDLRAWCAAASTGEEPYQLVMAIREHLRSELPRWQAGLLATDISRRALEKARHGIYRTEDVRSLPAPLPQRYFQHHPDGRSEVIREIREDVTFRRLNLVSPRFPFRRPMDLVFCRNVMIYFDDQTRLSLVQRLHDALAPGGWLVIGHAETVTGLIPGLSAVRAGVYRKVVGP